MKVAQLVREQQAEAKERERIHQELQVAALIQQTLLPKELPAIAGWQVDAFYRPAAALAATSTTSSPSRMAGSVWSSATSRTRACRPHW